MMARVVRAIRPAAIVVIAAHAASCTPAASPPTSPVEPAGPATAAAKPVATPVPSAPPCDDSFSAATLQQITRSPYAFERGSFNMKPPDMGLRGEVVAAYGYTTKEPILRDTRGRPSGYFAFAIVVTRWPLPDAGTPTSEEVQMLEAITSIRARHGTIALPGERKAEMAHLPGMIFVDWPREDGKTWLRFMWAGTEKGEQPPELEAWLKPLISDFYAGAGAGSGPGPAVEWHRIVRELDACRPP